MAQPTLSDLERVEAYATPVAKRQYSAQQKEMRTVQAFDWVSNTMIPGLAQAGAVLAIAAAGFFGAQVMAAAGIGLALFEMGRAYLRNEADLNRELVLYHNEIAKAVGKSPTEQLTIQDMRNAADEKVVGDKAVKPLQMELKHLAYRGRYNYLMGAVRALVTTVAAFVLQGATANLKTAMDAGTLATTGFGAIMSLTGAIGLVGAATFGIEKVSKKYFDQHEPPSAYHELTELQDNSKKQPLEPLQVFDVVVKLDKGLAKDIQDHLGKPYEELSYRNKMRVMHACEDQGHAQALTDAINDDLLPVTAVSMSAFHQFDWEGFRRNLNTLGQAAQASGLQPEVAPPEPEKEKSYVANLVRERVAKAAMAHETYLS